MKLTDNEQKLLYRLAVGGGISPIKTICRMSEREFDLHLSGSGWTGWLPLTAIRCLTNWVAFADMSDYPEMVRENGDWSGIRDSKEEKIWAMFEKSLSHLIPARPLQDFEKWRG